GAGGSGPDGGAERGVPGSEVLAELSARTHPVRERFAGPPSVRGCPVVPCTERDEPVRVLPILDQQEGPGTGRCVGGAHERRPATHELIFASIPHRPDPAGEWLTDPVHDLSSPARRLTPRVRAEASPVHASWNEGSAACNGGSVPGYAVPCGWARSGGKSVGSPWASTWNSILAAF